MSKEDYAWCFNSKHTTDHKLTFGLENCVTMIMSGKVRYWPIICWVSSPHFWLIINVTWSSSFFFLLQALIVGFRLIEMQLVPKKFVGEAHFATLRFNFVILGSFHLYVNNCDGALCQIYLSQLTYFILNLQHYYSWLKK